MKSPLVVLGLLLCIPLTSRADDASRRAKAEQLITILHMDRAAIQLNESLMRQATMATNQRYGGKLTPEVQKSLDAFQKKLAAAIEPQLSWNAIKPEYIRVYSNAFTDEQLDTILAFYKSPTGQAFLDQAGDLNQQVAEIVQTRMANLKPQLVQMFGEFEKTLPPATAAKPATPPAPASATPPVSTHK